MFSESIFIELALFHHLKNHKAEIVFTGDLLSKIRSEIPDTFKKLAEIDFLLGCDYRCYIIFEILQMKVLFFFFSSVF